MVINLNRIGSFSTGENTPHSSELSWLEASDAWKLLLNNRMQQVNWQSGSHVNALVVTCVGSPLGRTQFQFLITCSKTRTEGQSYLAQETQDHIPHEGVESGYDSKALASESVLVKCIRGMTGMTCVQSCPFKGKCST